MYNVMVAKMKNKPEEPFQGAEQEDKGWKTRRKDTYTRTGSGGPTEAVPGGGTGGGGGEEDPQARAALCRDA